MHLVSCSRAEEEAEAARVALEEVQAAAAGILGAFSSTTYQLRYNASVVIQVRIFLICHLRQTVTTCMNTHQLWSQIGTAPLSCVLLCCTCAAAGVAPKTCCS